MERDIQQAMIAARSAYIAALRAALLGPGAEGTLPDAAHELIDTSPISQYSIGILFPQEHPACHDSDAALSFDTGASADRGRASVSRYRKGAPEEGADESLDDALNMSTQYTPSSMGMTFLVRGACSAVRGKVSYAAYRRARPTDCRVPCTLPAGYVMTEEYTALVSYDRDAGVLHLKSGITEDEQKVLLQTLTTEAQEMLPRMLAKLTAEQAAGTVLVFTMDTHGADYLQTQEGQKLPVEHCIRGTAGWQIADALQPFVQEAAAVIEKPAFGAPTLPAALADYDEIELVGLCTDICVISNALLLKAFYPEKPISVDAACCAGVTPESHVNALNAMRMCQVEVRDD